MKNIKLFAFMLAASIQYTNLALASGGGGSEKSSASEWAGKAPEALFEDLAKQKSQETKKAVAKYIGFKLSATLPALGLKLVEAKESAVHEPRDIRITVRNNSGSERSFTFNLGAKKVCDSFEEQVQIIVGICLNVIKCIMDHELLEKHVHDWSFTLDYNMLPTEATLTYKCITINIADDKFFKTVDGKTIFDSSKVIAAIHKKAMHMRHTNYVCVISLNEIEPGEDACYLDSETAGNGSHTYYTRESLTTWVSAHGTGPISRAPASLADIKSIKIPARESLGLLGLPPLSSAAAAAAKQAALPGRRYTSLCPNPRTLTPRYSSLSFGRASLDTMRATLGASLTYQSSIAGAEAEAGAGAGAGAGAEAEAEAEAGEEETTELPTPVGPVANQGALSSFGFGDFCPPAQAANPSYSNDLYNDLYVLPPLPQGEENDGTELTVALEGNALDLNPQNAAAEQEDDSDSEEEAQDLFDYPPAQKKKRK